MTSPLLIGVSARIHHPEGPARNLGGVYTKTLHYLEQSVAHWVLSGHAMAVMIPAVTRDSIVTRSDLDLDDYAATLDGLVLQGGNDVAPAGMVRVDLAHQKHFIAAPGDGFADDFLRTAVAVHFRGIDQFQPDRQPQLQCRDFARPRRCAFTHPPGAQPECGHCRAARQNDLTQRGSHG